MTYPSLLIGAFFFLLENIVIVHSFAGAVFPFPGSRDGGFFIVLGLVDNERDKKNHNERGKKSPEQKSRE